MSTNTHILPIHWKSKKNHRPPQAGYPKNAKRTLNKTQAEGLPPLYLTPTEVGETATHQIRETNPIYTRPTIKNANKPNPRPLRANHAGRRPVKVYPDLSGARRGTQFAPTTTPRPTPKMQNEPNFSLAHDPKTQNEPNSPTALVPLASRRPLRVQLCKTNPICPTPTIR